MTVGPIVIVDIVVDPSIVDPRRTQPVCVSPSETDWQASCGGPVASPELIIGNDEWQLLTQLMTNWTIIGSIGYYWTQLLTQLAGPNWYWTMTQWPNDLIIIIGNCMLLTGPIGHC